MPANTFAKNTAMMVVVPNTLVAENAMFTLSQPIQ